jgi:23S rRNA (pseudouridine1915-N3)-methyltransferase
MPGWVQAGCETYLPRFRRQCRVLLEEIPASRWDGAEAQAEHGQRLLDRIKRDDWLVLLDERGQQWSTEELAEALTRWEMTGRSIILAIGGADGWNDAIRERADVQWSLSRLVFPHPLVRLIVLEQLYRADSVRIGHPYHRS